jgi:hypothetical protein
VSGRREVRAAAASAAAVVLGVVVDLTIAIGITGIVIDIDSVGGISISVLQDFHDKVKFGSMFVDLIILGT